MQDNIKRVSYSWTSDASGAWSATITNGDLNGIICRVTTIPSAASGKVPSSYNLTLVDLDSIDVLQGIGASRSATLTEQVVPLLPFVSSGVTVAYAPIACDGQVTVTIAGAGNTKSGKIIFHLKKG
jgi:hypothetical protein